MTTPSGWMMTAVASDEDAVGVDDDGDSIG
jgi:hypothetical protein